MFSSPIRHSPLLDCLTAICDRAYRFSGPNLRAALQAPHLSNVKRRLGRPCIIGQCPPRPGQCRTGGTRARGDAIANKHYFHLAPYEAPQSLLAKLDPASAKRTITLIRPSQSANKASLSQAAGGAGGDGWLAADGARLLNPNSSSGDRCFNPSPAQCSLDAGKAEHDRPHRER